MIGLQPGLRALYTQKRGARDWDEKMNANLLALDTLVNFYFSEFITSLPSSPVDGARYIVAASGTTGDLVGKEGQIVLRDSGQWRYYLPYPGWRAYSAADRLSYVARPNGVWTREFGFGLAADRPGANSDTRGLFYFCTDTGAVFWNRTGNGWTLYANGYREGLLADRPTASEQQIGYWFFALDDNGGTLYRVRYDVGTLSYVWRKQSRGVSEAGGGGGGGTPDAHASSHAPGGSDALAWTSAHGSGAASSRPSAGASNAGYLYFSTDTRRLERSSGSAWALLAAQPYRCALDSSDQLAWPLDESSGSSFANDGAQSGNTLSDSSGSPAYVAGNPLGPFSRCLRVHQAGRKPESETSPYTPGNTFTFSCWVRVNSFNGSLFLMKCDSTSDGSVPAVYLGFTGTGEFQAGIKTSSFEFANSTSAVTRNQWAHVGLTKSGTAAKMWVNGMQVAAFTCGSSVVNWGTGVYSVGGRPYSVHTADWLDGAICDARVADVARDEAWFQNTYLAGAMPWRL